ncbi:MAG: hypothetical protein DRQ97_13935 [Gammaproteobacteria bacterium]|nr:MAG: hypothetical protein DRQ97_13935 [Gammaproteobacteria bacterium]
MVKKKKKQQKPWQYKFSLALSLLMLLLVCGYFVQSFVEIRKVKPVSVAIERLTRSSPTAESGGVMNKVMNKQMPHQMPEVLPVAITEAVARRFPHLSDKLLTKADEDGEFLSLCGDYASLVRTLNSLGEEESVHRDDLTMLKSALELEILERLSRSNSAAGGMLGQA